MYLSLLNDEQKHLFIDIAVIIAKSDNSFSREEREVIESYCQEMQIPYPNENPSYQIKDLCEKIDSISTPIEKRIIVFEALGLSLIDNCYHESEKITIQLMANTLGVDSEYLKACEDIIKEYLGLQDKINTLVIANNK